MKVISLFCGAGGLDLGFIKAGHKIVWANDFDKDSVETYKNNIGKHVICKDITKVKSKDIPNADIVIGGFPCQGFSIANTLRNENDKRNKLYLELIRIIKDKQPKIFVAENVPGIKSLAKGKVFELILKDFTSLGYDLKYEILNSADYGTPQCRKRIIFFGVRQDINKNFNFPPCQTFSDDKQNTLLYKPWRTVKDAISDLPEPTEQIPNHIGNKHKVKINGYMGNRITSWDKPSPTIVGRGGGTGGPVIIPHPNLKRRLTPRECARLQDFPDDFIFYGSISSQFRQIGNAVPINLAYAIAKLIPKKL